MWAYTSTALQPLLPVGNIKWDAIRRHMAKPNRQAAVQPCPLHPSTCTVALCSISPSELLPLPCAACRSFGPAGTKRPLGDFDLEAPSPSSVECKH